MKLNEKEVKLIRKLRGLRSRRKKESLLVLVLFVVLLLANIKFGFFPEDLQLFLAIGLGWSGGNVLAAFSNIRADDKLYSLLMRYVDSDAEALEQIAQSDSEQHVDLIDSKS